MGRKQERKGGGAFQGEARSPPPKLDGWPSTEGTRPLRGSPDARAPPHPSLSSPRITITPGATPTTSIAGQYTPSPTASRSGSSTAGASAKARL